jgi:opacity protein-like surface antigen
MKKTLIAIAAATVLATGTAAAAQAATPAASGVVPVGYYQSHLWKYDYRPRYVCKHHYRWALTPYGWRNVYVGFWCSYTNND